MEREYQEAQPAEGFQALPDGDYICAVAEAELRDNKSNDGQHLYSRLQVLAGERKGASIFHRRALTGKTLPFVKADAKAFGLEELGIVALADQWPSVVGQEVLCKLRTTKQSDGTENQNGYLSSVAPLQQEYTTKLLTMAQEKGFAKESVAQMAKAQFKADLNQLTTTELKALGTQIKAAVVAPAGNDPF